MLLCLVCDSKAVAASNKGFCVHVWILVASSEFVEGVPCQNHRLESESISSIIWKVRGDKKRGSLIVVLIVDGTDSA